MTKPHDFLGREINEGDTLVYPVRQGSRMWLKKLVVRRLVERDDDGKIICVILGENEIGRRVTLYKAERSVVVEV